MADALAVITLKVTQLQSEIQAANARSITATSKVTEQAAVIAQLERSVGARFRLLFFRIFPFFSSSFPQLPSKKKKTNLFEMQRRSILDASAGTLEEKDRVETTVRVRAVCVGQCKSERGVNSTKLTNCLALSSPPPTAFCANHRC